MKKQPLDWEKINLAKKSLLEKLSTEEYIQYQYWYENDEAFRKAIIELSDKSSLRGDLSKYEDMDKKKAWESLLEKVEKKSGVRRSDWGFSQWYRYAAVLVGILVLSLILWQNHLKMDKVTAPERAYNISPGKDQAILRAGNGEMILLGEESKGEVLNNGLLSVFVDNKVVHIRSESSDTGGKQRMNELETPQGGRYQVQLPDGTQIWLNAQTKIQFPSHFEKDGREVNLWGEAYFEVVKDPNRPFRVNTFRSGMGTDPTVIKVLGTHFNVMAYSDEPGVSTTLVEGSVAVTHSGDQVLLEPGQQALTGVIGESEITVKAANIEAATGWKNRMFVFENEPLESIMRKIGRWYNVEVKYGSDIKGKKFSGLISQDNEIGAVMELLEATGEVHISFESKSTLLIK